jgi:hypothetical protein
MAQDWNPGGAPTGDQGQGIPMWQPPVTSSAQAATVSPRWAMAVISVLCFWPLGIAACVFAAKVKPSLQVGDVGTALKASSRVKTFFWISVAIFVLYLIIIVAASAHSNSGYSGS